MLNCDLRIPAWRARHDRGEEDRLSNRPRPKLLFVPPPLAFVLAFLAGVALNHARTLALPPPLAGVATAIGAVGIAAGAGMILAAIALFVHRRTTIIPVAAPARLVMMGPYRLTRNPMYLGLTLLFLGLALVLPSLWSLLFCRPRCCCCTVSSFRSRRRGCARPLARITRPIAAVSVGGCSAAGCRPPRAHGPARPATPGPARPVPPPRTRKATSAGASAGVRAAKRHMPPPRPSRTAAPQGTRAGHDAGDLVDQTGDAAPRRLCAHRGQHALAARRAGRRRRVAVAGGADEQPRLHACSRAAPPPPAARPAPG